MTAGSRWLVSDGPSGICWQEPSAQSPPCWAPASSKVRAPQPSLTKRERRIVMYCQRPRVYSSYQEFFGHFSKKKKKKKKKRSKLFRRQCCIQALFSISGRSGQEASGNRSLHGSGRKSGSCPSPSSVPQATERVRCPCKECKCRFFQTRGNHYTTHIFTGSPHTETTESRSG